MKVLKIVVIAIVVSFLFRLIQGIPHLINMQADTFFVIIIILSMIIIAVIIAVIIARYQHKEYMYKTFWKRVGAGIIDCIVLMPLLFFIDMFTCPNGEFMTLSSTIINDSIWLLYSICLHGKYGQTFGKMLFKIKVVTTEGLGINYSKAIRRDIFLISLAIANIFFYSYFVEDIRQFEESSAFIESYVDNNANNYDNEEFKKHYRIVVDFYRSPFFWLNYFAAMCFLMEIITMLSNYKRRSVHDFIAGTEVRRLDIEQSSGDKA